MLAVGRPAKEDSSFVSMGISSPTLPVLTNLKLRYKSSEGVYQDAAMTIPVTADGQAVGGWDDISTSGWNATQADPLKKPTRQTIMVGPKIFPVVRGNATAACLRITDFAVALGSFTIYLATTGLTGTTLKYYFDSQSLGRLILAAQTNTSGKVGWYDGTWHSIADATAGFQILTYKLVSGGNGTIYRNGVSLGSDTYTAMALGIISNHLFSNGQGNGSWAAVDMAEFLFYTGAHSDANRASVENYLMRTYGLI